MAVQWYKHDDLVNGQSVPSHFRNERFNYLDDLLVISVSLEGDFDVVII